jgi:hypothetical protein
LQENILTSRLSASSQIELNYMFLCLCGSLQLHGSFANNVAIGTFGVGFAHMYVQPGNACPPDYGELLGWHCTWLHGCMAAYSLTMLQQ